MNNWTLYYVHSVLKTAIKPLFLRRYEALIDFYLTLD
jgi:hypothetical protein